MNKDDFHAMGDWFQRTITNANALHEAHKISESQWIQWAKLRTNWQNWYDQVDNSLYVSDDDLAEARRKRNEINLLLTPQATAYVLATSTDQGKVATHPPGVVSTWWAEVPWWEKLLVVGGVVGGGIFIASVATKSAVAAAAMRVAPLV